MVEKAISELFMLLFRFLGFELNEQTKNFHRFLGPSQPLVCPGIRVIFVLSHEISQNRNGAVEDWCVCGI